MDISYLITPFFAWIMAGALKFSINSIKAKELAFSQVGYGGLPSNHSAIVSSTAMLIALKEGIAHPAFGVAVTLAFIVMLDANSLRRKIGEQAEEINKLNAVKDNYKKLREHIGHTRIEILAGVVVGIFVAVVIQKILN